MPFSQLHFLSKESELPHCVIEEAEAILDKEFKVLDKGFVRLVDYMGGDSRVVASARVSYGAGTKTFREDKGLINYLIKNDHTSPLEQVVLTFHIKLPIFVARQWIRHRTARINEISGRYSIMENEFYLPGENAVAYQSRDNKQGRSGEEVPEDIRKMVIDILNGGQKKDYADYETLIENNIAKELARITLPLSLYTQWYWQIDLHNLFHFLKLRLDKHAQFEIREYGKVIFEITKKIAPLSCQAFEEHVLNSANLSNDEIKWIKDSLGDRDDMPKGLREKLKNEQER